MALWQAAAHEQAQRESRARLVDVQSKARQLQAACARIPSAIRANHMPALLSAVNNSIQRLIESDLALSRDPQAQSECEGRHDDARKALDALESAIPRELRGLLEDTAHVPAPSRHPARPPAGMGTARTGDAPPSAPATPLARQHFAPLALMGQQKASERLDRLDAWTPVLHAFDAADRTGLRAEAAREVANLKSAANLVQQAPNEDSYVAFDQQQERALAAIDRLESHAHDLEQTHLAPYSLTEARSAFAAAKTRMGTLANALEHTPKAHRPRDNPASLDTARLELRRLSQLASDLEAAATRSRMNAFQAQLAVTQAALAEFESDVPKFGI